MDKKISASNLEQFYREIGKRVKKYRKEKGISQLELAKALGHQSRTIISLAELANNKHFNLEHLYKISIYLEIDICNLVSDNQA